ncbi:uncharacterized protein LOC129590040 [Paramacrobiotus metropolitanus]|uniref:uncharacterized protein LOC129590040 n=1 Tax=Paramacrobiotus metropolitanus TaxID=2943436 RepID=UPI002445B798|nr:uncharacterized protein LOC129590040 [Paramacrobiotus metropolitanus]
MDTRIVVFIIGTLFLGATDGDISPSERCILRDRTPIGLYHNVGKCSCVKARQQAVQLKNPYVPVCTVDGKFARVQVPPTNQGQQFCVDPDFTRVLEFGTSCR